MRNAGDRMEKKWKGLFQTRQGKLKGSRRSCRGVDRASMMKLSKLSPDPDWAPATKIHTKVLLLHLCPFTR